MTIADALSCIDRIVVCTGTFPDGTVPAVYRTVAAVLARMAGADVSDAADDPAELEPGVFRLRSASAEHRSATPAARSGTDVLHGPAGDADAPREVRLRLREDGAGFLASSHGNLLYAFLTHLIRDLANEDVDTVADDRTFHPSFAWNRVVYDFFLTQEGRIQKGLDRRDYVQRLAESGFTHIEVNGLAFPAGIETGPPGEAYPMFYTYCPALDQFVESDLGAGLYPPDYLSANLKVLRHNAELAREYGLVPGLLCFEPRSVPEEFFARYPMLRGARVDHPFRSFKPRYNMTITHPLVRDHYAQMVRRLMQEVPELGYLSVWSNDSGAGFEHTQSLYVGRNGGAYLVREWKDHNEIAAAAGKNALRFLETLKDAGREANPEFRVLTRMESFYGEHDVIRDGLDDGLDVEAASLVTRGWEMPYSHPRYEDSRSFPAGSIYQQSCSPDEGFRAAELEERSSHAHFYFAAGPNVMFAPLVGIPFPGLTARRLSLLHDAGIRYLAHLGGTHPPHLVPYNVNHEILRAFQFDAALDADRAVRRNAKRWAGDELADTVVRAWQLTEEAILAFPHVTPLYSTYGFVWYRLWARPLVPDIEKLPAAERALYQDFMCTTPHNPNNVDLSRDVLFELTAPAACRTALARIDANVWEPLDGAIALLSAAEVDAARILGADNIIEDQLVRLSALRCWFMTQRNVAAWVAGVRGTMEAESDAERQRCRELVSELIEAEIRNSERLLLLLDRDIEFMATTDLTETPLIHGRNLRTLLEKRIEMMSAHRDDDPHIDPEYIERIAGMPA